MNVTLGVMTLVFRMCPLEEALERIARLGFEDVALLGQHGGRATIREDMTGEEVRAIRRVVDRLGFRVHMAFGGAVKPETVSPLRAKIARTGELGIPTFLLTGPRGQLAKDASAFRFLPGEREQYAGLLAELSEYARGVGVSLALKPHGGPAGTAPGLSELVETPGVGAVGVFYDPGNVRFYMGVRPEDDLPVIAPRTTGLCVKDHRGPMGANHFPTPGDGEVAWPAIFRILGGAGFRGPALIEMVPGEKPEEVERELARTRDYLAGVLGF